MTRPASDETPAFKFMYEAEWKRTRFYQVAVVRALDVAEGQARIAAYLAAQEERLIEFDPEETMQVDPASVELPMPEEGARYGIIGASGRIYVVPGWRERLRILWSNRFGVGRRTKR